jgi:hypothetical protein
MRIMTIYPAVRCGWAIWDGEHLGHGVEELEGPTGDINLDRLEAWLRDAADFTEPELYVYERFNDAVVAASPVFDEVTELVERVAREHDADCTAVKTRELEKWATGKGNCKVSAMVSEANRRLGLHLRDPERAHAVLMVCWARERVTV